jgi:hypothetical protein
MYEHKEKMLQTYPTIRNCFQKRKSKMRRSSRIESASKTFERPEDNLKTRHLKTLGKMQIDSKKDNECFRGGFTSMKVSQNHFTIVQLCSLVAVHVNDRIARKT